MTMQIKVRIHPDRAPPPPDPRAARRDLRNPREVFFPPVAPPFRFFYVAAATPPGLHALTQAPLSPSSRTRTFALDRVSSSILRRGRSRSPCRFSRPPSRCVHRTLFPKSSRVFLPGWESIDAARDLPRAADAVHPAGPLDLARDHPRRSSRWLRRRDLSAGRHRATRRATSDRTPLTRQGSPGSRPASCLFFSTLTERPVLCPD